MDWPDSIFGRHCAVFLGEWIHIQDRLAWLGVSNISAFYWQDYIHLTWKGFGLGTWNLGLIL
jgi:hypothetical protein